MTTPIDITGAKLTRPSSKFDELPSSQKQDLMTWASRLDNAFNPSENDYQTRPADFHSRNNIEFITLCEGAKQCLKWEVGEFVRRLHNQRLRDLKDLKVEDLIRYDEWPEDLWACDLLVFLREVIKQVAAR